MGIFVLLWSSQARRLVLAVAASTAIVLTGYGDARSDPEVTGLRVGKSDGITRLVLTLSDPIDFRLFTLADPYRVVLEMPQVDWKLAPESSFDDGGLIAAVRFGRFDETATRVVVDVRRPVKVRRAFALRPSEQNKDWRLVIDIEPISAEEFRRRSETPPSRPAARAEARAAKAVEARMGGARTAGGKKGAARLIVLDPGHGGVDPGAISRQGIKEKDLVLDFARILAEELRQTGRYRVKMTRTDDYYVALRDRYQVAREAGASLFISIHADANPIRTTRGMSFYTLSEQASDEEAQALAARENRSDIIAGVDLDEQNDAVAGILIDLAQRETRTRSVRFANALVTALEDVTPLIRRPHRSAGFAVLKAPDVPSVLVELGYMTNRNDERRLQSESHRRTVVAGMIRAVDRYFEDEVAEGRTGAEH